MGAYDKIPKTSIATASGRSCRTWDLPNIPTKIAVMTNPQASGGAWSSDSAENAAIPRMLPRMSSR